MNKILFNKFDIGDKVEIERGSYAGRKGYVRKKSAGYLMEADVELIPKIMSSGQTIVSIKLNNLKKL